MLALGMVSAGNIVANTLSGATVYKTFKTKHKKNTIYTIIS
jgi:hypothetical protein